MKIEKLDMIKKGETANSSTLTINTHSGTHIDLPSHFIEGASGGDELLDREMVYEPTYIVDIPKGSNEGISLERLEADIIDDAEALLLRTGFFSSRGTDQYVAKNPYLLPGAATYLRRNFPRLQLLGIDAISIASPLHPKEGAKAHVELLRGRKPILILEDADLSNPKLLQGKWRLTLFPFVVDDVEAAPVAAFVQPHK